MQTNGLGFGVMSDIHLFRKPYRLVSALRMLGNIDVLLIAGDLADRGTAEQYRILETVFDTYPGDIPVFIVSGNHDLQQNDDGNFRAFERKIHIRSEKQYPIENDSSGAYAAYLNENVDLVGLNPLYDRKLFRFPNHGQQLVFLEKHLKDSRCPNHIILCHPPLIAHNPQRAPDQQPYLPREQDTYLQRIVDENPHTLFLSGHTHLFPTIETDALGNIYINDGSICPTQADGETHPGNVMFFEVRDSFVDPRIVMLNADPGNQS